MAELSNFKSVPGRRTHLKQIPKIDLTAMVDLAFLLITFFMLTTSLSQPTRMEINMPAKADVPMGVADNRTMTVCLGANNQMLWYMGTTESPESIHLANVTSIRQAFLSKKQSVLESTGESLIVLLKPDRKSTFKNLVDVLDEIAIVKVPVHAIVDITEKDREMLVKNGIL